MLELTALFLSISAITIDPDKYCENYSGKSDIAQYEHCIKGDLIKVNAYHVIYLCDFKNGIQTTGNSQKPFMCIYRGIPRQLRVSPVKEEALELRRKKEDELKKSGRKNL